mgnify:FL=1
MQTETWAGVIGSILFVVFLIFYRIKIKNFFKKQIQEDIKHKNEKQISESQESDAASMLETMYKAVKDSLPRKIEDGVEWKEQNLTPEFFEYIYYVDKSKNYTKNDFERIKKNMIKKRGNIKNIADLCNKTGRSLSFRYILRKDGSEHSIILNAKDFK